MQEKTKKLREFVGWADAQLLRTASVKPDDKGHLPIGDIFCRILKRNQAELDKTLK